MKLTKHQIEKLFKFTRQHYVEHYDIQLELVDHLANDIEAIWETEPKLLFEQARDKSFKKFGVFGFSKVVEERTKVLEKKYWKLVWNIFIQFFKLPQIIIIIAICLGVYEILTLFPDENTLPILSIACFVVLIIRMFLLVKQKKKRFKLTQKKWLFEEHIYKLGNSIIFFNVFLQASILIREVHSVTIVYIYAILYTVIILLVYIVAFEIPSKIEKILTKEHPEYFFVTNN